MEFVKESVILFLLLIYSWYRDENLNSAPLASARRQRCVFTVTVNQDWFDKWLLLMATLTLQGYKVLWLKTLQLCSRDHLLGPRNNNQK